MFTRRIGLFYNITFIPEMSNNVFIICMRGGGNYNSAAESYIPPLRGPKITNPPFFTDKSYYLLRSMVSYITWLGDQPNNQLQPVLS